MTATCYNPRGEMAPTTLTATLDYPGETHTHEMQPYGWVRMRGCRIEVREVPKFDFRNQRWDGTRTARFVCGTVEDSSYCGAFWGGMAMVKHSSDRFPPGTQHECELRGEWDLRTNRTIDATCG